MAVSYTRAHRRAPAPGAESCCNQSSKRRAPNTQRLASMRMIASALRAVAQARVAQPSHCFLSLGDARATPSVIGCAAGLRACIEPTNM